MKKVFSVILFIIATTGIIVLTVYTLNHREERQNINHVVNKQPEKVGSNMTDNNLSEIYSLYLNNQKHKLKFEYIITFREDDLTAEGIFHLYLDGKGVISENILTGFIAADIKELFNDEEIKNTILLDINDFMIVKYDDIEYILCKIVYNLKGNIKEEYFIFNDKGDKLLDKVLIKDSNINYISEDNEEFYYENNTLAKFEDNYLYSLEYKKGVITEYKYYIKNDELQKEEINSYQNIKIKK